MPVVFGSLSHVPGPIPCKLSGYYLSYFNISLQRTRKIYEWHAKYGPVICVGPEEVSVATPSLMREIYGSSGRYTKSSFFDQFVTYGERAVFAIRPYLAHREKRKPIVSFYYNVKKPWIESFINERVDAIVSHIDSKQDEISLDVYALVSHFAFDNISRLLYGERRCSHTIEIDGEERRILAALRQAQLWGPFHSDFPRLHGIIGKMASLLSCGSAPLHADDDLSRWNYDLVNELITTHSTEKNTLFHHLLNTETPDKTPRSLNYIASELYDNVNAAQITVATTLVYIIYHLSENPEWQVKIRDEILALSSEASGFPSFASIDSAPILDACIREVYRINPGTGGHAERVVPEGGKVFDSIYVPGGIRVTASTLALHHDAKLFPYPTVFEPDRWLGKASEQAHALDRSLIPFGYGARICAGRVFATMEIKLLIARLYVRYGTRIDSLSETTSQSMVQYATHDSVPRGLRCDVSFRLLEQRSGSNEQVHEEH